MISDYPPVLYSFFLPSSPQAGYKGFAFGRVIRKVVVVPAVVAAGARGKVGSRPQGKGQPRQGPGSDRPAGPFQDLAKIIGAGDTAVQPAVRDAVTHLAALAQAVQSAVRPAVDDKPGSEQQQADDEARVVQPVGRVAPG